MFGSMIEIKQIVKHRGGGSYLEVVRKIKRGVSVSSRNVSVQVRVKGDRG